MKVAAFVRATHRRATLAVGVGSLIALQVLTTSCAATREQKRENNFDSQWRFLKTDALGAEEAAFNDSARRMADLPHDWSIEDLPPDTNSPSATPAPAEAPSTGGRGSRGRPNFAVVGPFSPQSPGGTATGYTLGGTGWYRKHFVLDQRTLGKRVAIEFDGVYMDSDAWLNGKHLGNHPYGYTAFAYDLTDFLNPPGQDNVLAVRVRNIGRNSRWYSGSGIYRHVVLRVTDPLRVGQWGVSITTPRVTKQKATVNVVTTIENGRSAAAALTVRIKLRGPAGQTLQTGETNTEVAAGGLDKWETQSCNVTAPRGVHALYLKLFGSGTPLMNVDWWKLE